MLCSLPIPTHSLGQNAPLEEGLEAFLIAFPRRFRSEAFAIGSKGLITIFYAGFQNLSDSFQIFPGILRVLKAVQLKEREIPPVGHIGYRSLVPVEHRLPLFPRTFRFITASRTKVFPPVSFRLIYYSGLSTAC